MNNFLEVENMIEQKSEVDYIRLLRERDEKVIQLSEKLEKFDQEANELRDQIEQLQCDKNTLRDVVNYILEQVS